MVVISNNKKSWFASTHWYKQQVTVKSKEYNIEKTFEFVGSGVFANMPYWECKEGDVIRAELYSWKMESTGEITRRDINKLN